MNGGTCQLFVFRNEDGSGRVTMALPEGTVVKARDLEMYEVTGAVPPCDFPKGNEVPDVNAWFVQKQARGFQFRPVQAR